MTDARPALQALAGLGTADVIGTERASVEQLIKNPAREAFWLRFQIVTSKYHNRSHNTLQPPRLPPPC